MAHANNHCPFVNLHGTLFCNIPQRSPSSYTVLFADCTNNKAISVCKPLLLLGINLHNTKSSCCNYIGVIVITSGVVDDVVGL